MKKQIIAGLLFLSSMDIVQALSTPILTPDAFEVCLDADSGDDAEKPSWLHSSAMAVAEHIPEAVMMAFVVAICEVQPKYDKTKQWFHDKYQLTREKCAQLVRYIRVKLACKKN